MPTRPSSGPWWLLVPVGAVHLWLASMWPADRWGWGRDGGTGAPARIEVAFVRELLPAAPAAVVAPAEPRTRVLRALRAPRPASAAAAGQFAAIDPAAPEPDLPETPASLPPLAASLPELPPLPGAGPLPASLPSAAAGAQPDTGLATAAVAAAASAPVAFEWPPSTRLSYLLTGNYRGPVEGQAQVEWRLDGRRYQVALDLGIGPPMAPLVRRQLLSDGWVTAAGLEPRRYDEETHIVLRPPRRLTITLEAERIVLPSGRQLPRPAGVQDSASQFVQMTWLFTMQPARLTPGQRLELPLALPRQVEPWTYEVVGAERLATSFGELEAVHVRPQRPPRADSRRGDDLRAEFWVAPSLQYLPVRILIRQDEETYVDLMLSRLPQQASPGARPDPPPRPAGEEPASPRITTR
ncbi:MAG: DUF3108 domain-containing protein [Rubrivivax sp.]|nr:DUF3108 domain-containing protein [Rubrivivax sp.]